MKKFLTASFFLLLLTGCSGPTNVDKVDEKGYNPAQEQIIEAGSDLQSVSSEPQDSVTLQ